MLKYTIAKKVCLLLFLCTIFLPIEAKAAEKKKQIKNVLFIISDDLKASVLGAYGDKFCKTPNIDKLAKEGVIFENAYCQGTVCAPSRLSFMHSRYKGSQAPNLGEHLQENGLYTGRVGKIYHMKVPGDIIAGTNGGDIASTWVERFNSPGREAHTPGNYACLNLNIFTTDEENRQSTAMPHRMFVTVNYEGDGSDQPDHKTADKVIELLNKNKEKPFFIAAGFVRPHYPMVAPQKYFDMYPYKDLPLPEEKENDLELKPSIGFSGKRTPTCGIGEFPDNIKRMWAGYYASVTFMDDQVGRVIDELERLGLKDETAIIFTSDHGYHLGEHTFWQKGVLHEEVTRVPLIISVPGIKPGSTKSLAELVDIYPTVSELVGAKIPESVQGVSLVPVLHDPTKKVKDYALSFTNAGIGMRADDWAYMRYRDQSEELYDMVNDPGQFVNLIKKMDGSDALNQLRAEFEKRVKAAEVALPGKTNQQAKPKKKKKQKEK